VRDPPPCIVLLVLAAAALGGCTAGAREERLVLADVRQPATSLPFVAFGEGCFERERLVVEERTFELGRDALALLREGGADVAVAYATPLLRAAFADRRLRVVTALHTSTRNTRVVARRDRGIATFADLRGKRIGRAQGTNAEYFVDLALRYGGVPPGAAAVVDVPPRAAVEALARGELDAAALSDPAAAEAERALGEGARVVRSALYTEVSLLITRDDVLETRAPALRALVRGLACAERAVRERPDETLAHVLPRFPEQGEAPLREQLARVTRGLGLDNVLLHVLRGERDWLRASGTDGEPPDLRRLVDRRVLEAVEPEAVMLLPSGAP
jgi:ABC-type nitrate/sulfonate/bicarbonate transport system substrate-binding protein